MPSFIVIGDKTSHGGEVIGCSTSTGTHAKRFARVGDMVSCRKCRGVYPIVEGDPNFIDDGKQVAYHGCKVACGAVLISTQAVTNTTPSAGGGPSARSSGGGESEEAYQRDGFGHIGAGLLVAYQDQPLDDALSHFRGRFRVLDLFSGEPVSGQAARVRSTGGQYLTESTDAEGYTRWVERDATEALAFELIEQEQL